MSVIAMSISRRKAEVFGRIARAGKQIAGSALALVLLCSNSVANDQDSALLWSISSQGEPAGYLLGTIHSEDPRVLDFSPQMLQKLMSCEVYAMEMVPDLPTLQRLTEYMQYQDGTTLEQMVGSDLYERVRVALSGYQVPDDWISKMKVWAAVMTLSVPPPETGFFMDFSLSLRAAGSGLEVKGLETLEQQLSFLDEMPLDQQLSLLDQALAEIQQVKQIHDEMVATYLQGDLQMLLSVAQQQLNALEDGAREYFIDQGINARNHRMVQSALPLLQESCVFIAVGALHLPGDEGLIQLLRNKGFQLGPEAPPFVR